jgi:colicin import membrane protein
VKRKQDNVAPISFAVLLHVAVFGSMFLVVDFDRTPDLAMPLSISATLVTENAVVIPPKVEEVPVIEEPPVVAEPLPEPEPDTREQERLAAERQKREQDAKVERERVQKIERDKAEVERKRVEAETKRQADIERQRLENERLRKEAEAAARQQELDKESQRVSAMTATAKAAYMFAIQQKVERNWVRPANAEVGLDCAVKVQQLPGGEVVNVSFGACNGDATIKRSIESAVRKASPLPAPRDPSVFERNLTLIFKPKE